MQIPDYLAPFLYEKSPKFKTRKGSLGSVSEFQHQTIVVSSSPNKCRASPKQQRCDGVENPAEDLNYVAVCSGVFVSSIDPAKPASHVTRQAFEVSSFAK